MSKASATRATATLVIAIIVVGVIAGVGGYYGGYSAGYSDGFKAGKPVKPVLPDTIKIGSLMALSGLLGPMGVEIKLGVELAVAQVNERGGIAGRPVKLIMEDTGTDPAKALEAFKKLVEVDGVKVVIGPMASGELMAIGEYANERKVVVISPSATSPLITEKFPNDFIFRTVGSDTFQGKAMAEIMVKRNYTNIAVLVMDNAYGRGVEKEAKAVLGDRVVLTVRYDPTKLDFRTELEMVKGKKPGAVLYVGYYEDAKVMFKQALELGLDKIPWVAAEGIYGEPMFESPVAAEFMSRNVTGTRPIAPTGTIGYKMFYDAFMKAYKKAPGMYCDTAYDATMMALLAIGHAGEYDGAKIRSSLIYISQNYVGATGHKIFDENGDQLTQVYEIWAVKKVGEKYEYTSIGMWP
jgi:ABC-type branched-subunit amino acid transport system substrate-binding protein